MSLFQILVLIWLAVISVALGVLWRVVSLLTADVERVESLSEKVKHLFVKSTFEETGEREIKQHATKGR